jgi:hypothetical protein
MVSPGNEPFPSPLSKRRAGPERVWVGESAVRGATAARAARHGVNPSRSSGHGARTGEGAALLLLTLNLFLLLTTYYLLKVVREPLILLGGAFGMKGATLKAAATAAQAALLLGVVPAYGILASRVRRVRLITTVTLIFVACLVAFSVSASLKIPVGLVFFIWGSASSA